jgi:putative hemolysin
MDSRLIIEFVAILALVVANGFFALSEFSIIASRTSRLRRKRAEGKWGAASAEKLRVHPERFLASIQVGITLVGAMLGVFSGATVVDQLEVYFGRSSITFIAESATTISMLSVVLAITILSVVIGELVPKYMALTHPERFARYLAAPTGLFIKISAPFSRLLSMSAGLIVRIIGFKPAIAQQQSTEEEINQIILDGRRRGVFDATEQQFVRSVFEFTDSTVRRAMKPRTDVVGIERSMSSDEILDIIVENGYSRYPIYERTIDKVTGIIYTKDLIDRQTQGTPIELSALLRDAVFVPDSMPLPRLLREFQKGKNHMAVVLDEFGGTAGIITLEDVLEELVGEIQDEYDAEAAPVVRHSDSVVYADGDVWPGEVNEILDSHMPEDSHDTLAGLLMETTGRLPEKNETIDIADVRLTILAKDENRILRLKLEKIDKDIHSEP